MNTSISSHVHVQIFNTCTNHMINSEFYMKMLNMTELDLELVFGTSQSTSWLADIFDEKFTSAISVD